MSFRLYIDSEDVFSKVVKGASEPNTTVDYEGNTITFDTPSASDDIFIQSSRVGDIVTCTISPNTIEKKLGEKSLTSIPGTTIPLDMRPITPVHITGSSSFSMFFEYIFNPDGTIVINFDPFTSASTTTEFTTTTIGGVSPSWIVNGA